MSRMLLFPFLVALSLVAAECDFDLGDLNKYVVSYEVRVTNAAPKALAVVTVRMGGVTRTGTLGKGRTLSILGFADGNYAVTVSDTGLRLAQLQRRRDTVRSFIKSWTTLNDPAKVADLTVELDALMKTIAVVQGGAGNVTCTGTVKPGKAVTVVLSELAGRWSC